MHYRIIGLLVLLAGVSDIDPAHAAKPRFLRPRSGHCNPCPQSQSCKAGGPCVCVMDRFGVYPSLGGWWGLFVTHTHDTGCEPDEKPNCDPPTVGVGTRPIIETPPLPPHIPQDCRVDGDCDGAKMCQLFPNPNPCCKCCSPHDGHLREPVAANHVPVVPSDLQPHITAHPPKNVMIEVTPGCWKPFRLFRYHIAAHRHRHPAGRYVRCPAVTVSFGFQANSTTGRVANAPEDCVACGQVIDVGVPWLRHIDHNSVRYAIVLCR